MASTGSYNFVKIKEIRDDIVLLKDGGMRGVLMVTAMNLGLKSADEQEATIASFQNFLNTLDFSTQIVVQSRRMDIRPYLKLLEDRILLQKEELLRLQTRMYIEYVRAFADEYDVMKKHFFIVIPYTAETRTGRGGGFFSKIFGSRSKTKEVSNKKGTKTVSTVMSQSEFNEKRSQLEQRMGVVASGLSSMGLKVEFLNTEALIDLYYSLYNPGDTQKSLKGVVSLDEE
jgi:hypothetical protein